MTMMFTIQSGILSSSTGGKWVHANDDGTPAVARRTVGPDGDHTDIIIVGPHWSPLLNMMMRHGATPSSLAAVVRAQAETRPIDVTVWMYRRNDTVRVRSRRGLTGEIAAWMGSLWRGVVGLAEVRVSAAVYDVGSERWPWRVMAEHYGAGVPAGPVYFRTGAEARCAARKWSVGGKCAVVNMRDDDGLDSKAYEDGIQYA